MVFRGWYDFGGGSMADMGHYSLWTVFNALELAGPTSVDPMLSHDCMLKEASPPPSRTIFRSRRRAWSASSIRRAGSGGPVDLIWYDGGMHPPTPEELEEDQQELPREGMMFVGDKGKILAGFHVESPRLIPESACAEWRRRPRRAAPAGRGSAISPG